MKYPYKKNTKKQRNIQAKTRLSIGEELAKYKGIASYYGNGINKEKNEYFNTPFSSLSDYKKLDSVLNDVYGGCSSSASENSPNHDNWLHVLAMRLMITELENPFVDRQITLYLAFNECKNSMLKIRKVKQGLDLFLLLENKGK